MQRDKRCENDVPLTVMNRQICSSPPAVKWVLSSLFVCLFCNLTVLGFIPCSIPGQHRLVSIGWPGVPLYITRHYLSLVQHIEMRTCILSNHCRTDRWHTFLKSGFHPPSVKRNQAVNAGTCFILRQSNHTDIKYRWIDKRIQVTVFAVRWHLVWIWKKKGQLAAGVTNI